MKKRAWQASIAFSAILVMLMSSALAQQLSYIILLRYPRQTVEAERDGKQIMAEFQARVRVRSDGIAQGRVRWRSKEDGALVFQAVRGRGIFDSSGALKGVKLKLEDASGNVIAATVTPDSAVPGCDIWSFMSNGVYPALTFHAAGKMVIQETNM